jgi:predicted metal-dependent phosphoesterase TrpH
MKVDLHIHSEFSDGKYSPAKIVEYAAQYGLGIIALTDHDTVDGLDEALAAARSIKNVQVVPGVEFSTWLGEDELHILGYGIDYTHPELVGLLNVARQNRKRRVIRMLKTLEAHNVALRIDDVKNGFRSVCLGRLHVAHALREQRYVYTIREAFERYLSYDTGVITLRGEEFVGALEAVTVIVKAGGIPVFAHPTVEKFDLHLPRLLECGLRGVEVFKSSRPSIEEYYLETVAKDKGLLITGGSDWHGHQVNRKLGTFSVNSARIEPFLQALRDV